MILTTSSFKNKAALQASAACVCVFCQRVVEYPTIKTWLDKGQTAVCPHCDVDRVVGFTGEFDPELVAEHHHYYFKLTSELAGTPPPLTSVNADLQ